MGGEKAHGRSKGLESVALILEQEPGEEDKDKNDARHVELREHAHRINNADSMEDEHGHVEEINHVERVQVT